MLIAICDDDKRICSILTEKVKGFCPDAQVVSYTSGVSLLKAGAYPDILLLDIRMPDMNGMDVAKMMRDKGWQKILIFVTGEEDKVFNAFDLHAFHFLVKPVADEKLRTVLKNAREELGRIEKTFVSNDKYISIQSGPSHISINLSQLLYAEVFNRKIILHMDKENIEYYGRLSALEELVGKDFYHIHRSYIVNMKFVQKYDRASVTLLNGDIIPIARREYDGFLKEYMEYSLGRCHHAKHD